MGGLNIFLSEQTYFEAGLKKKECKWILISSPTTRPECLLAQTQGDAHFHRVCFSSKYFFSYKMITSSSRSVSFAPRSNYIIRISTDCYSFRKCYREKKTRYLNSVTPVSDQGRWADDTRSADFCQPSLDANAFRQHRPYMQCPVRDEIAKHNRQEVMPT